MLVAVPAAPGVRVTSTFWVSADALQLRSILRLPAFAATLDTAGGVASYSKGKLAVPTLPARSVHEPTTEAPALSGPE